MTIFCWLFCSIGRVGSLTTALEKTKKKCVVNLTGLFTVLTQSVDVIYQLSILSVRFRDLFESYFMTLRLKIKCVNYLPVKQTIYI